MNIFKISRKVVKFMERIVKAIIRRIKRFFFTLTWLFWGRVKLILVIKHNPCILVFGAPWHSNLGDNAQTLCIGDWLKRNYVGYRVVFFKAKEVYDRRCADLQIVRKYIKKSDLIFLHSGYQMTDLYRYDEWQNKEVVKLFPDKRIIILPQTINYTTDKGRAEAVEVYNGHSNIVLMCRDEVSYKNAEILFPRCKKLLVPDMVTSLIGKYQFNGPRSGILLCLRNDKEVVYAVDEMHKLMNELKKIDTVDVTDTTVSDSNYRINKDLRVYLESVWRKYSHYKVVVTDRYHGTIFSLIAGTPVIVLSSSDHKLSSGVKWFPREFSDYISYVPDLDMVCSEVKRMWTMNIKRRLPMYFEETFFMHLKEEIG